jgi:hypothetical protein
LCVGSAWARTDHGQFLAVSDVVKYLETYETTRAEAAKSYVAQRKAEGDRPDDDK